ncbi:MAG: hypothetical protein OXP37_08965 [Chloroflexota bacterium]|nr:hypothetical protein [Chloroflexota bacterium]
MKPAALFGTLSVGHRLPAGARLLCSSGQEVIPGAPIAEFHAPRKVRAVPLKHLEGAEVGDPIPAGTTVGGEGGWRGRRREIDWDARVVALNSDAGYAFLSGPEIRSEIKARIGGVVGPIEPDRLVEITGEGLAMYCPIARGPSVFGTLALRGGDSGEAVSAYPDATVLAVNGDFDPDELTSPRSQNLAGLLLPGMPDSWLADDSDIAAADESAGPAPITYGVVEAVTSSVLPEPLWAVLEAYSGCPVSLTVDADSGTGEFVVSGSADNAVIDCELVRGFGPDGIITGRRRDAADIPAVRIAGGRLLEGARLLVGKEAHALAAANTEWVISKSASSAESG